MNGRGTYSGGVSNVNHFNETFNGLLSRTFLRQQIDTGGLADGRLAHNKRVSVNADYGIEAELNDHFAVSDAVSFWNFRIPGHNVLNSQIWAGTDATHPAGLNALTPLSAVPQTTESTENFEYLGQKNFGNTILGIATITPQVKISGGWRFNDREIKFGEDPTLAWHENWLLLGGVVNPSSMVRVSANYDLMRSKSANSPDADQQLHARFAGQPRTPAGAGGGEAVQMGQFCGNRKRLRSKEYDPAVNHKEHNRDISFGAQIIPRESLSLDFNYGA